MIGLIIVTDMGIVIFVEYKGGIQTHPVNTINRFQLPVFSIERCILKCMVCLIIVADSGITIAVQGEGGVQPDTGIPAPESDSSFQ